MGRRCRSGRGTPATRVRTLIGSRVTSVVVGAGSAASAASAHAPTARSAPPCPAARAGTRSARGRRGHPAQRPARRSRRTPARRATDRPATAAGRARAGERHVVEHGLASSGATGRCRRVRYGRTDHRTESCWSGRTCRPLMRSSGPTSRAVGKHARATAHTPTDTSATTSTGRTSPGPAHPERWSVTTVTTTATAATAAAIQTARRARAGSTTSPRSARKTCQPSMNTCHLYSPVCGRPPLLPCRGAPRPRPALPLPERQPLRRVLWAPARRCRGPTAERLMRSRFTAFALGLPSTCC